MSESPDNAAPQQPQQPQPTIEERISRLTAAEEAPAPTEPAETPETAQAAPEPAEEAEPGDPPAAEDAAAESAEAKPAETTGEDVDPDAIEIDGTLEGLAEHLGVDVADLYENVTIPIMTEGGVRHDVKVGDWKDGWQANQEATKLREDLMQKRDGWEAERTQLQQAAQHKIAEAAGLADQVQAAMLAQFNNVDWASLRDEDPAAWAAKRQDMQEAAAKAQSLRQGVQAQIAQHQQALAMQQQEMLQQRLSMEREALVKAAPEFGDAETGPVEMQQLRGFLRGQGFSEDEVSQAYDHRLIVMAQMARKWAEHQKSADPVRKKVVKVARATKPGPRQSPKEQQHDRTRAMRAQLRKSGKVDDAAALIAQLNKR